MELIAVACHQFAAALFQSADGGLRKYPFGHKYSTPASPSDGPPVDMSFLDGRSDSVERPGPDDDDYYSDSEMFSPPGYVARQRPSELYHPDYEWHNHYPQGVDDIVGYWAELRLFGGVILFDRGPSSSGALDVFFHSAGSPYYIYQVPEDQLETFISFALSDKPSGESQRFSYQWGLRKYKTYDIGKYNTMRANIFRDQYERKLVDRSGGRHSCVIHVDEEDAENYRQMMVNHRTDPNSNPYSRIS